MVKKRFHETIFTLTFSIISYFIFLKSVHYDAINGFYDTHMGHGPKLGNEWTGGVPSSATSSLRAVAKVPAPPSAQE